MEFQGFPRIHSIFYAEFDIVKGTFVKHQVPEGSITPQSPKDNSQAGNAIRPLIDFGAISEYVIPKKPLYKRLVTIRAQNYKVMGCPVVLLDHDKYRDFRNEFRFNLCFVFEREAEISSYEAVVRKLARMLEVLEVECDFLSQEAGANTRTVQNVIEQLFEDLNSYCECQIPINKNNTINLKLFPTYPNPPPIHDYQVPVATVDLKKMMTVNWDLAVQLVAAHMDGIRHVKAIAELANVKPEWARQSMQHLMYYGCILMTDIFQFSNIYAVKPEITRLLEESSGLSQECLQYITLPNATPPPLSRVFALYCGLQYGLTVRNWIQEHQVATLPIDVRRFISFGVIKGLIYRVHKYPILVPDNNDTPFVLPTKEQAAHLINRNTDNTIHPDIIPYLDGRHHYDEICTALACSPKDLDEQLGVDHQESRVPETSEHPPMNAMTQPSEPPRPFFDSHHHQQHQQHQQPQPPTPSQPPQRYCRVKFIYR